MSTVPGEAEEFVSILVQKTKASQQNRNVFHQPPYDPHFSGSGTELWGGEAALDFLEFHWKVIRNFLISSASSRKTQAQIPMPTMGPRAVTQAISYVKKALPGCEVSFSASSMTIDWSAPVNHT